MRTPLEISLDALREIVDVEKSANYGWNAVNNMVSIARRALIDVEKQEAVNLDKSIEADAFPQK